MIVRIGVLAASAAALLMLAGCKTGGMKVSGADGGMPSLVNVDLSTALDSLAVQLDLGRADEMIDG
jgi:hypothetical protein